MLVLPSNICYQKTEQHSEVNYIKLIAEDMSWKSIT